MNGGQFTTIPKKFVASKFLTYSLLAVVASQLDRHFYGIEYSDDYYKCSTEAFIEQTASNFSKGYKFLIFVGDGDLVEGLPTTLATRLANRLHRKIYLKIKYLENGIGVIEDCRYCDRTYKSRKRVVPQMLTSVFVPYNRNSIIDTINKELDCDFTDILIADTSIDIENNTFAICGNI